MQDLFTKSPFENKLNFELLFCTNILKLNSLHYGYWNNGEKVNLETLRKAQLRYTESLISLIPKQVNTILDVGCGTGDIAVTLAKKGFEVTAISPDINHKDFLNNFNNKNIAFYDKKFEEIDLDKKFDLILMSESQNYFDTNVGFRQCRNYLKKGGFLLVSGIFRKKNTLEFNHIINIEKGYVKKAKGYNLEIVDHIDITNNILPTLELVYNGYNRYFIPFIDTLKYYFDTFSPVKMKLLQWFCNKELKQFVHMIKYYEQRLDPCSFQKYVKYIRILFKIK